MKHEELRDIEVLNFEEFISPPNDSKLYSKKRRIRLEQNQEFKFEDKLRSYLIDAENIIVNDRYLRNKSRGFMVLKKLLKLEIDCLEFGAFGGTNFTAIEIMRSQNPYTKFMYPLATLGHNATEMVEMVNSISDQQQLFCKHLIISGGIQNFLDGYYLTKKSTLPALYGMANVLLQHALSSKDELFNFIKAEVEGYKFASNFLSLKK